MSADNNIVAASRKKVNPLDIGALSRGIKDHTARDPEQAYRNVGYTSELKRQGSKLVGLCPLHEESNPSFKITITPKKHAGKWYCFGCGEGGSIIDFVQQLQNIADDGEAVRETARLLNIANNCATSKPQAQAPAKKTPKKKAAEPLNSKLAETHHKILLAKKNSKHLGRFMKARALSLDTIKQAQIGFDGERFTIPIYDGENLVDIRKYKLGAKGDEPKLLAWEEGRGATRLYGWDHVADETQIVLTEGELDALCLIQEGFAALSATNGAGKWPEEPPDLTGKVIIICGDADEAGQNMNRDLPAKLYAAGASQVKVLEWPAGTEKDRPGFDVTDYFLDGGTGESFHELMLRARIIRAPRRTSWTLKEFRTATFPEPQHIVPGILPEGLTVMAARPKVGKSLLLMQIAASVLAGGKCLGRDVQQGAVLLILLEGGDAELQQRMKMQDWPAEGPLQLEREWPLYSKGGIDKLRSFLTERDYLLVGIDTFSKLVGAGLDQDKVGEVTEALSEIYDIGVQTSTTIILIDHFNKMQADDPIDAILGSTAKAAIPDGILGLYRQKGLATDLLRVRGRDIAELDLPVKLDQRLLCWQAQVDEQGVVFDSVASQVLDALELMEGKATASELATATGKDRSYVCRELLNLEGKGLVVKGQREGRSVPYLLKDADKRRELFP